MPGHLLMLPLDKAQLNLLQLIFYKDREMKKDKEYMSGHFYRRLGKKGQEEEKVSLCVSLNFPCYKDTAHIASEAIVLF